MAQVRILKTVTHETRAGLAAQGELLLGSVEKHFWTDDPLIASRVLASRTGEIDVDFSHGLDGDLILTAVH